MLSDDRKRSYEAIEEYRRRPLIVYTTSTRRGLNARMAGDAVREFIDQLEKIKPEEESIDILVHSSGGDALAAWRIMSILRERFKHIAVLVPFEAFSAATVFALGANEIIMHPNASLGPIDPQISARLPDGQIRQFAYEDLGAFLGFLRDDVRITEQPHISMVLDKLFAAVDPLVVGAAKRASDLSAEVGERLLSTHLDDSSKAKQIAVNLNKSFFAHGDAVSRRRAKQLDLQIADVDTEFENMIWSSYLLLEKYMDLRSPFVPLEIFLSDKDAAESLKLPAPLGLPPNATPEVANSVWSAAANQALQRANGTAKEVPFSIVNAMVESVRKASEHRTQGKIGIVRQPSGELKITIIDEKARWNSVRID